MNLSNVLLLLVIFVHLFSYISLINAILSILFGDFKSFFIFIIFFLILFLPTAFFYIRIIKSDIYKKLTFIDIFAAVPIIWLIYSIIAAIPFIVITKVSPIDSLFESMSALTTTGLSIFKDVEVLPKGILLWRSLLQWIGGIGIAILSLAGLFAKRELYLIAEGRSEKIVPNLVKTLIIFFKIYILLTIFGTISLCLLGVNVFEALNHTMTALATGGMTVVNSFSKYSESVLIFTIILMILGATNFKLHYLLVYEKKFKFFQDSQFKSMLFFILLGTFIVFLKEHNLLENLFNAVSAITGTGFSVGDLTKYSHSTIIILIILMILGGCTNSTTGALKQYRVIVVAKLLVDTFKSLIFRGKILKVIYEGKTIAEKELLGILLFIILYIFLLFVFSTAYSFFENLSFEEAMFLAASAQGNVGLTIISIPDLKPITKILIFFEMWLGRLEIISCLFLFYLLFSSIKAFFTKLLPFSSK